MLQKYWFYIIVTLISVIALASALIAEFYFNLAPCEMCLKQREPYYIIILGFIFIAILRMADTYLVLSLVFKSLVFTDYFILFGT